MSTKLNDHADWLLALDDVEDVLEGERLEVKLVRDIEVGRDRLRIRVDHDRLVALLAERQRRAHATVVELNSLPDAVRAAAENDDRLLPRLWRLTLLVVAAVQVRRRRREFTSAGVDHLVGRDNPQGNPARAGFQLRFTAKIGELFVGEAEALHSPKDILVYGSQSGERPLGREQLHQLRQKPAIDPGELIDLVD